MQGINKKLLWSTIILAALLIGILSFLAGSYFGRRSGSNTPSHTPSVTPSPSGGSSAATQVRTPQEILYGQMFWADPDFKVGLAIKGGNDINVIMNGESFLLDQVVFFDPVQVDGDWMNCTLEMHSMSDDHMVNIGLYITETDDLGAYINTFCGDVRTTMYPTIKNPFAMYAS